MFGRKTRTEPTPAITPFTTRSFSQPSFMSRATFSPNQPTRASIQSIGYWPSVNVASKIRKSRTTKIGNASHLFVTTASILSVTVFFPRDSACGWKVSARAPWMKAYFASTMPDSAFVFSRDSMRFCSSARAASSSARFGNAATTASMSLSPSRYLMAR